MSISSVPPMRSQSRIRSIPVRKTPAAVYGQLHQLANEKERLQQEFRRIGDRQAQIVLRLEELDRSFSKLEAEAADYAIQSAMPKIDDKLMEAAVKRSSLTVKAQKAKKTGSFDSMTIEY